MIKHVLFEAPKRVKWVAYPTLCVCVGIHMRGLGSTFGTAVVLSLLVDVQSMGVQLILGIKGRHRITKEASFSGRNISPTTTKEILNVSSAEHFIR